MASDKDSMSILYRIFRRIRKTCMSHEEYMNWEEGESFRTNVVNKFYSRTGLAAKEDKKALIFMANGYERHGGLADRLRGAISTYIYAKENGLKFYIFWNTPFQLQDYLIPNEEDWVIENEDIVYELPYSCPFHIGSFYKRFHIPIEREKKLQIVWMNKAIENNMQSTQFHAYSNAHFGESRFQESFKKLFKPHPRLELKIKQCIEDCGEIYIAASFRFVQLLGDFEDRCGGEQLSDYEKEQYIEDSLNRIKNLHEVEPNSKILIACDSSVFMQRTKKLDYTYVIPGCISHIDNGQRNRELTFDKEFLDLFLLSKARKIYRFHKDKMHYSGFPLTAGLIGGVEVKTIEY